MNLALAVVTAASIAMFVGDCSNMNTHYDPSKFHHRPNGFQNPYLSLDKSEDFWKWQIERLRHPPPETTPESLLAVEPALDFLARNRTLPTLTWIGHSTLLLQLDGLNILTDPVFGERASPVSFLGPKRHQRPGIALADLPHIDAVLISHNHCDHLELAAVKMLQQQPGGPPRFYVPLCLEQWFAKNVPGAALEGPDYSKDTARAVSVHWGTFERLTDESLDQAPRDLQAALRRRGMATDRFFTLQHGQTLRLTPLRRDKAPL